MFYYSKVISGTGTNPSTYWWSDCIPKWETQSRFHRELIGRLRQHGRANENPTIAQALKSSQNMQIINSIWVDNITSISFEDLTKLFWKTCRHCSFKYIHLLYPSLHLFHYIIILSITFYNANHLSQYNFVLNDFDLPVPFLFSCS